MAFRLIESWLTYGSTGFISRRWPYQGGGLGGTGGKLVTGGVELNGSALNYCNTHFNPLTSLRFGFWFTPVTRAPTVTNSSCVHTLDGGESNAYNQIGLGHNPNGTMSCFSGPNFSGLGGTTLANGTTVLSLNTAYWLELYIDQFTTSASGNVELRINGVTEFVINNVVTAPHGNPWIDGLSLAGGDGITDYIFSALYIGDGAAGWLGPCNVQRLLLAADTTQKDFTPSSGTTHYSLLNDLNNSTTNVGSNKLSATDLYTLAAPTYNPAQIFALESDAVAINQGGPDIQSLVGVVKTGSTSKGFAAAVARVNFLPNWYQEPRPILTTDADGSPWTYSSLTAAQIGVRLSPWGKGINFRATAGHVTDDAYNTYSLGELYPTTRNGVTFGWDGAVTTTDVSTGTVLYGGVNSVSNTGTQRTFRIDVPASGRYQLRLMIGGVAAPQRLYAQVKDGSTPLFTIDQSMSTANNVATDAAGVAWPLSTRSPEWNTPRVITLTGTALNITIGTPASASGTTPIAHVELVALDTVGTLTATPPAVNVDGLFAEVLMSTTVFSNTINVTQGTPTVVQSGTVTIDDGYLVATASGDTASQVAFTVGTPPAHGTLKKSGSSTSSFTQADVDNGLITYVQNGDAVVSDSFVFTVSAPGATTTGNLTFHITITPTAVVTAPIVLASNPLTTARNGTEVLFNGYLLATATAVADTAITYTVTTPPTYGTIYKGGSAVSTFTQADIDNGQVVYTQNGANVAFDQLVFTASSSGLTSLTGQVLGIFIEDPGSYFSNATVQPCPTSTVCAECELSTVPADSETSTLGCCT